ncbi:hypothetical protein BD289DRAFT_419659 [Coniella lustricola]|uniref:Uncharacterized protein n=1 Tax=Coniella lustricola TaxID=2025994 RepID=A0A2T3AND8_9PEZI|nr:hypothetical protein BD289DRAFT_419659 [Coniella lustricola]
MLWSELTKSRQKIMGRWLILGCFLPTLVASVLTLTVDEDNYQSPIVSAPQFAFRDATIADIDGIATVHYEAFRQSEASKYIYQFADDVDSGYTWTCERDALLEVFGISKYKFKVLTVPEPKTSLSRANDGIEEKVVSISVWAYEADADASDSDGQYFATRCAGVMANFPSLCVNAEENHHVDVMSEVNEQFNCSAHLNANMTRAVHLQAAVKTAEEESLVKPFARRFKLELLATHPHWDGNGFAAQHLHWGKDELARLNYEIKDAEHQQKNQIPMVLVGTPAGYPLYIAEGFEGVKNISIERLDGKGILWWEAMVYKR